MDPRRREGAAAEQAPRRLGGEEARSLHDQLIAELAISTGAFAAIAVPAVLVPLRGDRTAGIAIAALVFTVVGAGLLGGRAAGVFTGFVAACALDFFSLRPYDHLALDDRQFYLAAAAFVALGALFRPRRRSWPLRPSEPAGHDAP